MMEDAADGLRDVATNVSRLYRSEPVIDLSGGRDSRLVASAFVASGADVVLHSHDAVPGDLVTARELVAVLDRPVEHRITHRPTGGHTSPPRLAAVESARRWHRYSEGLRPCSFLTHSAPTRLDANPGVVIGGVGGEVAHGFFYPAGLGALEALPVDEKLERFARAIVARHAPVPGASAPARAEVEARVLTVLRGIAAWGITDARMLDYYYLRERLRRWGTTGERLGTVSPLLAPSFMHAALSMTPGDRKSNSLHRGITRQLVPAWADVPYFPSEATGVGANAPAATAAPPQILRLADSTDADEITGLLAETAVWARAFDLDRVHRLWHRSVTGKTTAAEEHILRRVIWRGAFEDHLADVNGTPRPTRDAAQVPTGTTKNWRPLAGRHVLAPSPTKLASLPVVVSSGIRRHPTARALARTRLWRVTQNTRIGDLVRRALRR